MSHGGQAGTAGGGGGITNSITATAPLTANGLSGTPQSGNVTLAITSPTITWQTITASQGLVINNGYICISAGGALSLALPAVSVVGSIIEITLDGSTSFTITQGASQQIRMGNTATTVGVGGSLASTAQGDSVRMVCSVANLKWNILSSMGNPTIV